MKQPSTAAKVIYTVAIATLPYLFAGSCLSPSKKSNKADTTNVTTVNDTPEQQTNFNTVVAAYSKAPKTAERSTLLENFAKAKTTQTIIQLHTDSRDQTTTLLFDRNKDQFGTVLVNNENNKRTIIARFGLQGAEVDASGNVRYFTFGNPPIKQRPVAIDSAKLDSI